MAFHVGQRVVCVNTCNWPRYEHRPALPTRGGVYTVRAIVSCVADGYDEDGLRLVEIVNPKRRLRWPSGRCQRIELCFRMSRFRPVRTTSIDVFTRMLEPVPKEPAELVDA
jgi:hypothetical protein